MFIICCIGGHHHGYNRVPDSGPHGVRGVQGGHVKGPVRSQHGRVQEHRLRCGIRFRGHVRAHTADLHHHRSRAGRPGLAGCGEGRSPRRGRPEAQGGGRRRPEGFGIPHGRLQDPEGDGWRGPDPPHNGHLPRGHGGVRDRPGRAGPDPGHHGLRPHHALPHLFLARGARQGRRARGARRARESRPLRCHGPLRRRPDDGRQAEGSDKVRPRPPQGQGCRRQCHRGLRHAHQRQGEVRRRLRHEGHQHRPEAHRRHGDPRDLPGAEGRGREGEDSRRRHQRDLPGTQIRHGDHPLSRAIARGASSPAWTSSWRGG